MIEVVEVEPVVTDLLLIVNPLVEVLALKRMHNLHLELFIR